MSLGLLMIILGVILLILTVVLFLVFQKREEKEAQDLEKYLRNNY